MNAQVIALVNQKGGVGKSTSCVNLGVGLAQVGKKDLLLDFLSGHRKTGPQVIDGGALANAALLVYYADYLGFCHFGGSLHKFSRLRRNRRLCNRHEKGAGYRTSASLKGIQHSEMCLPVAQKP